MNYELTKKILAALEREKVRYVVFGAVAINLLGLARATEDLDLFIAPEAENIERLKAALRSVFDDPTIDEIKTEELLGEYPAISKRRFKISTVFPCPLRRRRRSTG